MVPNGIDLYAGTSYIGMWHNDSGDKIEIKAKNIYLNASEGVYVRTGTTDNGEPLYTKIN